MAQDRFLALCIFSALRSGGAVFAKVGSALVFPVSVPVCGGIMQRAVFRADHVVEIFIVNIRPPGMAVLLGFRAGVAGGWSAAALRVGCGYHRFFLFGRLFVTVVRKGLFSVFFPVFVYLFEQFSCIYRGLVIPCSHCPKTSPKFARILRRLHGRLKGQKPGTGRPVRSRCP